MKPRKQDGYVLLMLLMVIAIGLTIYYMDIMWMGTDGRLYQAQNAQDDNQPWKNEALIKTNQPAKTAAQNSGKPILAKPMEFTGPVSLKAESRGNIEFTVKPDGSIAGKWQCQYSYTHAAYEITAEFAGNTDASQNAPADNSKLMLVAKGTFAQKTTNLDSGEVTENKGIIYFNGWLDKDFTASGTISTTTDKKWHADYDWNAKP